MKAILLSLFFAAAACAADRTVVFDNRPEDGIPPEATAQERVDPKPQGTLPSLVADSIQVVRVRYYHTKTWTDEKKLAEYVSGLFDDKRTDLYTFPIWSQGVGEPEIECIIDFTDAYRQTLAGHQKYYQGRLLVWGTVGCFRDGTGKWWFVSLFKY